MLAESGKELQERKPHRLAARARRHLHERQYEFLLAALIQHVFTPALVPSLDLYTRLLWPANMVVLGILSVGVSRHGLSFSLVQRILNERERPRTRGAARYFWAAKLAAKNCAILATAWSTYCGTSYIAMCVAPSTTNSSFGPLASAYAWSL